jgi:hypothetical protein
MAQIYPALDLVIDFDLVEECHKIGPKKNLRLTPSPKGNLEFKSSNEKHYPFERFDLK